MNMPFIFSLFILVLFAAGFFLVPLYRAKKIGLAIGFGSVFVLASIGLYRTWGDYPGMIAFQEKQSKQQQIQKIVSSFKNVDEVIVKLKQRLATEPDSPMGWFLLGRLYLSAQRFQLAEEALARAHQLKPQDPKMSLSYVEAVFFNHHRTFTPQTSALLSDVLTRLPDDPDANSLAALRAYLQKDYTTAIVIWERFLKQVPPRSPQAQQLLEAIALAHQKQRGGQTLSVQIRLKPDWQNQSLGKQTLFVYAKAWQGPPMPLAIVKRPASDLPLTVILSDDNAMTAALSLTRFERVKVYARISRTGQAIPQKGDLIGESGVIVLENASVSPAVDIMINKVVS